MASTRKTAKRGGSGKAPGSAKRGTKAAAKRGAKGGAQKAAALQAKDGAKPKRSAAQKKGLAKVAKLMAGIDLCMMTTRGEDGAMHARPMSNNGEVEFDGEAWFFSSQDTAKVLELERDPRVGLTYTGGTKKEPVWIAVEGEADIVRDDETKRALWLDELEQWFQNGPEDPNVVVLHVRAHRIAWWSYGDEGEVDLT